VRLQTILRLATTAVAMLTGTPSQAEWAPTGPITMVVPFGTGGSTDIIGRVFVSELERQTGWRVLVENRPGVGGVVGTIDVINAKPDGQTIGLASIGLFAQAPYMPGGSREIEHHNIDFLGTISAIPYAIVASADAPFDDLAGMAAYFKTNGPLKYASTAPPLTVALELLAKEVGFEFVAAETTGSAESIQLVAGGHADFTLSGGVHVPFVLDGRMKVIAHFMDERGGYAPNAATVAEQGATLPLRNYFLFMAPKGLPDDTRQALTTAIDKAVNSDALKKHASTLYVNVKNLGPEGARASVAEQAEYWSKVLAE